MKIEIINNGKSIRIPLRPSGEIEVEPILWSGGRSSVHIYYPKGLQVTWQEDGHILICEKGYGNKVIVESAGLAPWQEPDGKDKANEA